MYFKKFFVKQRDDVNIILKELKDDFIEGLYSEEPNYPVLAINEVLYGKELCTYLLLPCDNGLLSWVRMEYFQYAGLTKISKRKKKVNKK